jgi:hypothetical protein
MNKYFNNFIFNKLNINDLDMHDLKSLSDEDIEILITNPLVKQSHGNHQPAKQVFKNNQEMIFTGCSETQGYYIRSTEEGKNMHKHIWGFDLSDMLGFDSVNLGIGGESAYRIIQRLLSHFKEYGNPKNLFCFFPDPYRFTSPKDDEVLVALRSYSSSNFLQNTHHNHECVSQDKKYIKKPYFKEDVISKNLPLFFNFQAISTLEQYCEASEINFLWGSWHPNTNDIVKIIKSHNDNEFKSFIDLSFNDFHIDDIECHPELYIESPELYTWGSDKRHIGIHGHKHVADKFFKAYSREILNEGQ